MVKMARRSKFWPGRIFRATKPFYVKLAAGPVWSGQCAKGDVFIVVEDLGKDSCFLCLSESVRWGCEIKCYLNTEHLRPATDNQITFLGVHLLDVFVTSKPRRGLD